MTEYWKSQARKYCEFCKCWFADNKVSISFHENGKRHKENVQKHISTLSKKSAKELKQKEKMDDDIKKMEAAAMAAYLKDVQNNADLTSQSISFHENGKRHKENVQKHISTLSKKSAKELKQKEKMDDDIKKMEAAAMAAYLKDVQNNADLTSQSINEMVGQSVPGESNSTIVVASQTAKKASPVWNEIKSEDGSSYFWNTVTNETTWDPPDEYLSIADQEKKKLKEEEQDKKKQKLKKQKQKEAQKEVFKEVNAHLAREKMRELAVNKDDPPPAKCFTDYGPAPRAAKPYGSWTPVVNEKVEAIDLQLPKPEKELPPPPVIVQPEIIQFKEKRVQSLGDEPVEFKKRKFNNPKKNMRQKLDDD